MYEIEKVAPCYVLKIEINKPQHIGILWSTWKSSHTSNGSLVNGIFHVDLI